MRADGEDERGLRVLERAADLVLAQPGAERHGDRTGPVDGEQGQHERRHVRRDDSHPLPLERPAQLLQAGREAVHGCLQLGVAERVLAVDERGSLRHPARRVGEQRRDAGSSPARLHLSLRPNRSGAGRPRR